MHNPLPPSTLTALLDAAIRVRENAYAPFSNYKVGAALLTDKGNIYVGCNVESPTLTLTTHAEGSAIDAMIAGGERGLQTILFVSQEQEPGYPCALCRQKIIEVSRDALVIGATLDRRTVAVKIQEIYPVPFAPGSFT
jgi:cytidine deaminase